MKRFLAFSMTLLLAMSANAADTRPANTANFKITPHWKVGDIFHFDAVKTQTKSGNSGFTIKTKYAMEIRVLKSDAKGYVLEWFYTDFEMIDPPDPTGEVAKFSAAYDKDLPVRYRVGITGEPTGHVENWEQVCIAMSKSYDLFLETRPEDIRKKLHDSMADMLKNPVNRPTIEAATLTEPSMLHVMDGVNFSVDAKPVAITLPIPMKVGGELPAHATREIVRQDASEVVLRHTIEYDPGAGKILLAARPKTDPSTGQTPDEGADLQLKLKTICDATFNRTSGFPKLLRFARSMAINDAKDETKEELVVEIRERTGATSQPYK